MKYKVRRDNMGEEKKHNTQRKERRNGLVKKDRRKDRNQKEPFSIEARDLGNKILIFSFSMKPPSFPHTSMAV